MTHKNGKIFKTNDPEWEALLEKKKLELEIKMLRERVSLINEELINIPHAIEEFGYIVLINKETGKELELVSREREQKAVCSALDRKYLLEECTPLFIKAKKEISKQKDLKDDPKLETLLGEIDEILERLPD